MAVSGAVPEGRRPGRAAHGLPGGIQTRGAMSRVPPLAPGGFLFVGGGVWILLRGLSHRNPYEIILGAAALVISAVLGAVGFRMVRRLVSSVPVWIPPGQPVAVGGDGNVGGVAGISRDGGGASDGGEGGIDARGGNSGGGAMGGGPHLFEVPAPKMPWFFRLHLRIRGRLDLGGGRRIVLGEDLPLDDAGRGEKILSFPLSGVFHGSGRLLVRDVFGLFALPAGIGIQRTLRVLPAPLRGSPSVRVDASTGTEDRQNRRSSDEERYHMREYVPGDRYRDINWKTSSRLALLVTRISPFAQEKTRLLQVELRSFGPARRPSLAALWALDRTKARLLAFLRALGEEHPDFVFRVRTPGGERDIASAGELEDFASDLAGLSFSPDPGAFPAAAATAGASPAAGGGELFLFSTSFDTGLPACLASRGDEPTRLFLTTAPAPGEGPDPQVLRLRRLFGLGLPWGDGFSRGPDFLGDTIREGARALRAAAWSVIKPPRKGGRPAGRAGGGSPARQGRGSRPSPPGRAPVLTSVPRPSPPGKVPVLTSVPRPLRGTVSALPTEFLP